MSDSLRHRNLGRFFVMKEHIDNRLDKVKQVMEKMVVLEARFSMDLKRFDYVAISDLFENVIEGEMIPSYKLYFKNNKLVAEKVLG
jgi:hypothetical protein